METAMHTADGLEQREAERLEQIAATNERDDETYAQLADDEVSYRYTPPLANGKDELLTHYLVIAWLWIDGVREPREYEVYPDFESARRRVVRHIKRDGLFSELTPSERLRINNAMDGYYRSAHEADLRLKQALVAQARSELAVLI